MDKDNDNKISDTKIPDSKIPNAKVSDSRMSNARMSEDTDRMSCVTEELVTDSEYSDAEKKTGRRRRRRTQSLKSPALAYHTVTTLSIPESIAAESETIEEQAATENLFTFRSMSRNKKLTVINFCTTNLFVGCFYSLLGPFFPTEAAKKGVSTTLVGLIFAGFELTIVIASPIFGTFLTRIGAKFLYVSGVFVCGTGAILFGFLDASPDGTIYVVMCFLVRCVEALGAAALATASFAIVANTFPDNVATMFGSLEMFSGLGLMLGPPIGGVLFQLGGFKLPFMSLGVIVILVGFGSIFVLPSQEIVHTPSKHSMLTLLRIPIVSIMGICLMSGSGSIGFVDVTLSIFLKEQYNLSPIVLGAVFLVGPGVYALTAPMWGWIVDKTPQYNKFFILCGYTLGGIAFYLMGPAPFLPIPHMLWLVIVSLMMMGFGIGTLVITFQVITEATLAAGYPENLDTYGLIAGVFNSFFCFGAFAGPLGGGYLHDVLKFEMSAVVIGSCSLFAALLLSTHMIVSAICRKLKPSADFTLGSLPEITVTDNVPEKQPLLSTSNGQIRRQYSWEQNMSGVGNGHRPLRTNRSLTNNTTGI